METVFIKILNMSITAGWIVLAVIVARFLLKKAPKWISVLLWSLVGVRLVCPFSLKSIFSLIPNEQTVPSDIMYTNTPTIQSGITSLNSVINPVISESLAPNTADSVNPMQIVAFIASIVWLIGIVGMLIYFAVSYLRIRIKVREAVAYEGNVYLCDQVASPFILGAFCPKIYLPSDMGKADCAYVIAHENAHLKRLDHLWKPLGFLLLSVYWFNPVLWIAYILLCRDIEYACDEKVIKDMGTENKKAYSDALINCSVPRRAIAACPLAFGEVGIKGRIKSVLSYKKPTLWIIIAAIVLSTVLAVCFLTDPSVDIDERLTVFIDCEIASHRQLEDTSDNFSCLDWEVIGKEKKGNKITVYMWTLYGEFDYVEDLVAEKLVHTPTIITVEKKKGEYHLIEYWEPSADLSVKDKFPSHLWDKALSPNDYYDAQLSELTKLANEHFAENQESPQTYEITDFTFTPTVVFERGNAYKKLAEAGAVMPSDSSGVDRGFPVIKITSKEELTHFKTTMDGGLDLDYGSLLSGSAPTFEDVCEKYNDEYFKNNTLLLIYIYSGTLQPRYSIEFVEKNSSSVSIGITEISTLYGDDACAYWLFAVDIPSAYNVESAVSFDASITSYIRPNKISPIRNLSKRYVFNESDENNQIAVNLLDNGIYAFTFWGGYVSIGTYEQNGNRLKLTDQYSDIYCFDVYDGYISFDFESSTERDWITYNNIKDGSRFLEISPSASNSAKTIGYSFTTSAVGFGDYKDYDKMIEAGAYIDAEYKVNPFGYFPLLKITSKSELESIKAKMDGILNFVKGSPTFDDITSKYDDAYFEDNTLLLIYAISPSTTAGFSVESVNVQDGKLTVGITEIFPDAGSSVYCSWLVGVDVPKSVTNDVNTFEAKLTSCISSKGMSYYTDFIFTDSPTSSSNIDYSKIFKRYAVNEEKIKCAVTLFNNGKFSFWFGWETHYIGYGNYEQKNGRLKLLCDDGNVYYFDVVNDQISFDAKASSEVRREIEDGTVFSAEIISVPSDTDSSPSQAEKFSYVTSPIDYVKIEEIKAAGFNVTHLVLDSKQHLPYVRIESMSELEDFKNKMDSRMNFNRSYADAPSFNKVYGNYNTAYFKTNTLLLIFPYPTASNNRFAVEFVNKHYKIFQVGISVIESAVKDKNENGWIIAVNIPNKEYGIDEAERIDVELVATINESTESSKILAQYVFVESEDVLKPTVTLYENGRFMFTFAAISSYIGFGNYKIENDRLMLYTDDLHKYYFDIDVDKLIFDAEVSSTYLWYSDIKDGSVFKLKE